MKRFIVILLLCIGFIISLLAQNPIKKKTLPQENSKVTKEYDEKGNLTRFDSVYTYSWSGGDTTMMKSFSPKNFPDMFSNDFGFFADSTFKDHPFFDDFDQLFAHPFNGKRDSMFMKRFEQFHNFRNFDFSNDSITSNFDMPDYFFDKNGHDKTDSISTKMPHDSLGLNPKTMEEMMQMLQLHMQEMQENQRKFFDKQSK